MDLLNQSADEYVVVEFPNEQKKGSSSIPMAIISSKWIYEEAGILHCWWPQYISSSATRTKSVKFHYDIDKSKSISCFITVKYHTADYDDALEKIKILEIESEIESEIEDSRKKKKIRSQDYEYNLSDLEEQDNVPPVPPPEPNYRKTPQINKDVLSEMKTNAEKKQKTYHSLSNVPSSGSQDVCDSWNSVASTSQEKNPKTSQEKSMCCCDKNFVLLTKVWKEIQQMKTSIDNLSLISSQEDPLGICDLEIPKANSYEDLQTLESKLLHDPQFYIKLQKRLALIGGKDPLESTRNILSVLISHPLALTMNFSGKSKDAMKQKNGLAPLEKVLSLIIDSVRSSNVGKEATDKDVQVTIMNWFRTAADREGGRIRRLKTKSVD